MSEDGEYENRYITLRVRVHWKTPRGETNDDDTDLVYQTVKWRIEKCIAANVCGQVGVVPGTEKMELLYGVTI